MPNSTRTARTWIAAVALFVIAVGVQQTYSNVARRPAREDRPPTIEATSPDAFTLARLYLSARRPAEAAKLFRRLWKSDDATVSRATLAAYLGSCAELQGDYAEARAWYRQADDYFVHASARLPRESRVASMAFRPPEEPPSDEVRQKILTKIDAAEERVKKEGSPQARVLLMSWRFLYAELGVVGDRAVPGLALDQFGKALAELESLEKELQGKPDVKKAIEDDKDAQTRFDFVRVRLAASMKKFTDARVKERGRLQDLRNIVLRYRGTEKEPGVAVALTQATTALMLGDRTAAAGSLEAAGKQIDAITKLVADAKDANLFEDEKEAVTPSEVTPFSKSFRAHLGMMRGYLAVTDPSGSADDKKLADAETLAKDALVIEPNNPLGLYVLGLAAEGRGLLKTRPNPADEAAQKDASKTFDDAADHLTKATGELAKSPSAEAKALGTQIQTRVARLKSADAYLAEARKFTAEGKIDEAFALLGEGQLRHRDADLWSARAEFARRAHLQGRDKVGEATLKEMTAARDAKLFTDNDFKASLAEGKLLLALADADIVRLDKLDGAGKKALGARLEVTGRLLQKALDNAPKDRIERARCTAYLSLALAYGQIVTPSKDPRRDAEVRRAFTLASDAVKEIGGLAELSVEDREALSAAQLSRGHLAVQILPAFREEAQEAFARAIAESAALPYPTKGLGSLGTPFLSEIKRRPENAYVKRVEELTKQRRVMAGFVDGVMVLTQNQPTAAVRKMEQGLDWLKKPVNIEDPLEEIDMEDRLVGYLALGQIEAGKPGEAVLTILRTLDDTLTEAQALAQSERLAARLPSPLLNYALAVALEKRAEAFGLGDQPLRAPALAGARAAYARAVKMLDSPAADASTPGYRLESEKALARLEVKEGYKKYLALWQTAREDNRLLQAEQVAREGLTRHPTSPELWRAYLDTRLSRLTVAGAKDKEDWKGILDDLDAMSAQAGGLRFERSFWEGLVRQQLKEYDQATTLFETARKLAPSLDDQVRAQTRVVEARLQMAPAK